MSELDPRSLSVGAVVEMLKLLFARSDKYYELQHSACLKYMASVIAITPGLYYLHIKDRSLLILALALLPLFNIFFVVLTMATAMSMVSIREQIENMHERLDGYLNGSPIRPSRPQWAARNVVLSVLMLALPVGVSVSALYAAAEMGLDGLSKTLWAASALATGLVLLYGLWQASVCCKLRNAILAHDEADASTAQRAATTGNADAQHSTPLQLGEDGVDV